MKKIACVGCLDDNLSVHTETFTRAVRLFCKLRPSIGATIGMYDDKAEAGPALGVARRLVADRTTCVVGHFSSDAANAAAPIYSEAGIPLILPGATRAELTEYSTTFRVCDPDTAYASWLENAIKDSNLTLCRIVKDQTLHGSSLASLLSTDRGDNVVTNHRMAVFVGRYHSALDFLEREMKRFSIDRWQAILLTDDAYAYNLIDHLNKIKFYKANISLLVAALVPDHKGLFAKRLLSLYKSEYNNDPGSYFWETIASLEIAQSTPSGSLPSGTIDTVLGPLSFDSNREANPRTFKILEVTEAGFVQYKK